MHKTDSRSRLDWGDVTGLNAGGLGFAWLGVMLRVTANKPSVLREGSSKLTNHAAPAPLLPGGQTRLAAVPP